MMFRLLNRMMEIKRLVLLKLLIRKKIVKISSLFLWIIIWERCMEMNQLIKFYLYLR
jgi:hypothetical protein